MFKPSPLSLLISLALTLTACGGGEPSNSKQSSSGVHDGQERAAALGAVSGISEVNWLQVPTNADPLLDSLQPAADADVKGMWSPLIDWPINAIHMVLLPSGKLLTYGTRVNDADAGTGNQDGGANVLWDPAFGASATAFTVSQFATDPKRQINSFCSAGAMLSNGHLLTSGGFGGPYVENQSVQGSSSFMSGDYDPTTNLTVDTGLRTADERWYATMLTLPDGRPILLGGMLPYAENSWNNPSTTNGLASMTPEVYTPGVGWSLMPGAASPLAFGQYRLRSEFPHAWVAPNGQIFGISSDQLWFLDPAANGGNGSVNAVGQFKVEARGLLAGETNANLPNSGSGTSSAVMFAPGKVLQMGGNGYWVTHDLPASSAATVFEIGDGTVKFYDTAPMAYPRRFFNSTVLPNGDVLANGGTRFGNDGNQAVLPAEAWNPSTGKWSTMAPQKMGRLYHNTASLLPSGAVISAGGGNPGPIFNRNAEVFFPPYLFKRVNGSVQLAPRPNITGVTQFKVAHQASFSLLLGTTSPVREVVMMGLTVVTHNFNPAQRRIPLSFTQNGSRLDALAPNTNLTPPGYYMVFVVDADGVPSRGVVMAVGQDMTPPPVVSQPLAPVTLSTPLATPTITVDQVASFSPRLTVGDALVSWNFGDGSPATAFAANGAVQHQYTQPGIYTVVLNMQGVGGVVSTYSFLQLVSPSKLPANLGRFSSAMALEPRTDGPDRLWVVNPDHNNVVYFNTGTGAVTTYGTYAEPRAVAVASNSLVGITTKTAGVLMLFNSKTNAWTRNVTLPRGSQPHGLVFSPDGSFAYVALEGLGQVVKINTATGVTVATYTLGGAIRHLSLSGDGLQLAASRFITPKQVGESDKTVDTSQGGGEIVLLNTKTGAVLSTVRLAHSQQPDTAISARGVPNYLGPLVRSPDETVGWVPSKQDNIARGAYRDGLSLDFQDTVRAVTSKVDLLTQQEVPYSRIDHDNASVASAAAFHPTGLLGFVTLETSRELVVIDVAKGLQLLRVDVGFAPQAVLPSRDGRKAYVYNYMSRSVSVVNLASLLDSGQRAAKVDATWRTTQTVSANEAGKRLFYDARDTRLARDSYMSCASCHADGDGDGRTWDFTNFGEGLRNTPSLRGRVGGAFGRMHWTGNFDEVQDFETQIRAFAGGTGLMTDANYFSGTVASPLGQAKAGRSTDLDALAAFVNSLTAVPASPYRTAGGGYTTLANQGYTAFVNKQCNSCHTVGAYTNSVNNNLVDVGTLKAGSGKRLGQALTGLDVPSLRAAWATGPYLHNGSAATIDDAIRAHTKGVGVLTDAEVKAMSRFIQEIEY